MRKDFRTLGENLINAKTIQERVEMKHHLSDLLKSLKSHYQLNDDSTVETVIGFAPEVLNPLSNPTDLSKYSDKLLAKPVEWIRDWWRRRPLRHVFNLRKRLYQISQYEHIVSELLDIECDSMKYHVDREGEYDDFYAYYNRYLALYGRREEDAQS